MPQKKGQSRLAKGQRLRNLAAINSSQSQKENVLPPEYFVPASVLAELEDRVCREHERGNNFQLRMNNERRKDIRSKAQIEKMKDTLITTEAALDDITKEHSDTLKELKDSTNQLDCVLDHNTELKKTKDAFQKQKERAPARIALAAENGAKKATTHQMRECSAISEPCREMVRELVQCGVPVKRVNDVIHIVCETFNVEVPDGISA